MVHLDHWVHQAAFRIILPAHQDPLVDTGIFHLALQALRAPQGLLDPLQAFKVNHGACPIPTTSSSKQPLLREMATLMQPNLISSQVRTPENFGTSLWHASWSSTTSHRSSGMIINVSHMQHCFSLKL